MADESAITGDPFPADFRRATAALAALGGKMERRRHHGRLTRFVIDKQDKFVERCSCGEPNLMSLPYEGHKKVTVCMVCDAAYRFPRLS